MTIIASYVEKLIKKYKTRNPFEIADYQNITIRYESLPDNIRGMAVKVLKRKYIVLNEQLEKHEINFICAHELGHHNFHSGHSYQFISNHSWFVNGRYEKEANIFAAHLLIHPEHIEYGDTPQVIASKAGVPIELLEYLQMTM